MNDIEVSVTTSQITGKYLDFETCRATLNSLQQQGRRIVLCHGVFDLLHPGHIAHLQEAAALGDVLVVSITSAPFVNRGPGRPIFSDELRLYSLASLACVDYVLAAPVATALEVIDRVQPHVYCKGLEYADPENDVTGNIQGEIDRVRSYGGEVDYTGKIVFSSTRLVNNHLGALAPAVKDYASRLSRQCSFSDLRAGVEAMQKLKVLVLGDVVIDEFIHCTVQGLTGKGKTVSARFQKREMQLGGSLAVARHLAGFAGEVTMAGVVGNEPAITGLIRNNMDSRIRLELQYADDYATVVKSRYIERQDAGDEYTNLFAVNYLQESGPDPDQHRQLSAFLEKTNRAYDLVVVADYGHGLMNPELMDLVQDRAPFLALNCQTNTANYGFNLITRYRRADSFCLDERELRLAYASRSGDHAELLQRLSRHLGAQQSWLSLAASGSLGRDSAGHEDRAPALTMAVQDTIGAGDAFFALASLSARLELPLVVGSLLGNLAGAMSANVLGNAEAIERARLLKFAATVLKV